MAGKEHSCRTRAIHIDLRPQNLPCSSSGMMSASHENPMAKSRLKEIGAKNLVAVQTDDRGCLLCLRNRAVRLNLVTRHISWRRFSTRMHTRAFALCMVLLSATALLVDAQETPGTAYDNALKRALVGNWRGDVGGEQIRLELAVDGTYEIGESHGTYSVIAGALKLAGDASVSYQVTMAGRDALTLSGGDPDRTLSSTHVPTGAVPESARKSFIFLSL